MNQSRPPYPAPANNPAPNSDPDSGGVGSEAKCLAGGGAAATTWEPPPPMSRVSAHRPPALRLPSDPRDAAAQALAFIRGDDSYNRAAAIEAMSERVALLRDGDSDAALEELAAHLPILEALYLRAAVEATAATKVDHKSTLLRMSLSAQRSYSQTLALLVGLRRQGQGSATVLLTRDDDLDGD